MTIQSEHIYHMRSALNLARYGLGRTAPNPTVGCVLVKDNHVVGRGHTNDGGRPHAETVALDMAGDNAKGATAYVTLEPCSHQGETAPCAKALIDAGIKKVFVAILDTDKRVSGRGIKMMQQAGIDVEVGLLKDEAFNINKGFFLIQKENRPLISLKTASTLDGKIATATKQSKWITGDMARRRAHLIRAQHDAIAVGVNTVLEDNPSLTTRLDGVHHHPKIFIFDRQNQLTGNEKIFENNPTIISADTLQDAVQQIGDNGVTRLLIEGGATLMTSFIKEGLYDQLYWFRASSLIGADGLGAVQHLNVENINSKINLRHAEQIKLGRDVLDIYKPF